MGRTGGGATEAGMHCQRLVVLVEEDCCGKRLHSTEDFDLFGGLGFVGQSGQ